MHLGACKLRLGEEDEGWHYLEMSKEAEKDNPELYYIRGTYLAVNIDESHAASEFETGLEYDPNHPGLLNSLGIYSRNMGRKAVAEDYFRRSLRSDPHNRAAGNNLAVLLWKEKRFDEANSVYRRLFKEFPDDETIREGRDLAKALAKKFN